MRADEIVNEKDIPEGECGVCYLHEKAYNTIFETIQCPVCKEHICKWEYADYTELEIVGETNGYAADENIETMNVTKCPHCKEYLGNKLIPIIYNANHDIYYTGGREYLIGTDIEISDNFKNKIENYTKRIKDGDESINADSLTLWLQREVEHMVAKALYENGLKY